MANAVTISTHNGSKIARDHNIRNLKVVLKEEHIDPTLPHEIWVDEQISKAYKRIFGDALSAYNKKQKRDDRKIKDYYQHICDDKKKHPAYEMIIGIYGKNEDGSPVCSPELGKKIMQEFVGHWKEQNPNLELIGAYYHADEPNAEPHVHIDYIPVAHGFKKGLSVQSALVKALNEQGYNTIDSKNTAQIQWERKMNDYLTELCEREGFIVDHPQTGEQHRNTPEYKEWTALNEQIDRNNQILNAPTTIPTGIEPFFPTDKKKGMIYPADEIAKCFEMRRAVEIKEEELRVREEECARRGKAIGEKEIGTKKKIDSAAEIVAAAKRQAEQIISEAHAEAQSLIAAANEDATNINARAIGREQSADEHCHKMERAAKEWSEALRQAKEGLSAIEERERNADVQELQRIISTRDAKISALQKDLDTYKDDNAELERKIEDQNQVISNKEKDIYSLKNDLSEKKQKLKEVQSENTQLQVTIEKNAKPFAQLEELRGIISQREDYQEIKDDRDNLQKKVEELTKKAAEADELRDYRRWYNACVAIGKRLSRNFMDLVKRFLEGESVAQIFGDNKSKDKGER